MGNVATLFKVYTKEGNTAEDVSKRIVEKLHPKGVQLEEIAFGIKIIKVLFVHEDTEGSASFEEKIRAIEGVEEVEVSEESLL
ncbi:MAG: hypothetical protein M1122_02260 [Candidatus Marsarchaeota archaeon]|jgi:translation elongation factor EF-1beta|nr:hypothetical protein [Candidatus Marsarchaeota archaeon]